MQKIQEVEDPQDKFYISYEVNRQPTGIFEIIIHEIETEEKILDPYEDKYHKALTLFHLEL